MLDQMLDEDREIGIFDESAVATQQGELQQMRGEMTTFKREMDRLKQEVQQLRNGVARNQTQMKMLESRIPRR